MAINSFLSHELFQSVVKHSPLISIDLIVKSDTGQILLGKRNNRPAQGFWFVPGGRILKDESIEDAFIRILRSELGLNSEDISRQFVGVYEHFYDDNFSGEDFSTHYVVLAYELQIHRPLDVLPIEQHSLYNWFNCEDLLKLESVHAHTKWYFK